MNRPILISRTLFMRIRSQYSNFHNSTISGFSENNNNRNVAPSLSLSLLLMRKCSYFNTSSSCLCNNLHQSIKLLNHVEGMIPVELRKQFHTTQKSMRKRKQVQEAKVQSQEDIDEEEIIEYDSDTDNTDVFEEDDRQFNTDYKDIKAIVKSLRLDSIASTGLNISRNKIDEYYLSSQLRLCGERVMKKSKKMEVGDYIDVITEQEESSMKVKRVRLLSISSEKTQKDKFKVKLRIWRQNTKVAAERR